jgi:hypothetical protein
MDDFGWSAVTMAVAVRLWIVIAVMPFAEFAVFESFVYRKKFLVKLLKVSED